MYIFQWLVTVSYKTTLPVNAVSWRMRWNNNTQNPSLQRYSHTYYVHFTTDSLSNLFYVVHSAVWTIGIRTNIKTLFVAF